MESKLYNKRVNVAKKSRFTDTENKPVVSRGDRDGGGDPQGGGVKGQTVTCKISCKDIVYNTGSTGSIL